MKSYGDEAWERLFSERGWGRYPSEEAVRFFARARTALEGELRALDIGCGVGALTWFLAREGARVTAYDGSPAALSRLSETLAAFGSPEPAETITGDITRPQDFITGSFDLLLDHYSLYANPAEKVRQAYTAYFQFLKPGGFFLSCLFGGGCSGLETGERLGPNTFREVKTGPHKGTGTISVFSISELETLFAQTGYNVEYIEHILHERDGEVVEKHVTCLTRPGGG